MNTQTAAAPVAEAPRQPQGLVLWAAGKFGVDAGKVFPILKQTCFRGEIDKSTGEVKVASDAEVAALMIVAREHGLNPFLKEIYAFPDKKGGIVPVVGIDGWIRITNEHPQYDGVEFGYEKDEAAPAWIECKMFRKDRKHPTVVREFLKECSRDTGPWKSHPSRMLRHKTFIQCARVAFGFAGIYDEDEAHRIIEGQATEQAQTTTQPPQRGAAALKTALVGDGLNITDAPPKPNPPEPSSGDPKPKEKGTLALLEKYTGQFQRCTDAETLAIARDEARMYDWAQADQDALDTAYSQRQDEIAKAKK